MVEITSLTNSLIKKYASLKNKKYRDQYGLFILDDIDAIKVANDKNLLEAILFKDKLSFIVNDNVEIIKTTDAVLNKISNCENPNGVVAIAKVFNNSEGLGNTIIVLDGVQDPGNGGTILRSALAFNFTGMIVSLDSFDVYNGKFIRATKGAFFDLPILRTSLVEELKKYKKNGYKIVIADLKIDSIKVNDFKFSKKTILVVGSEGQGVSKAVKEIADETVYIPISSKMESLNVGVAASIIMSKNIID